MGSGDLGFNRRRNPRQTFAHRPNLIIVGQHRQGLFEALQFALADQHAETSPARVNHVQPSFFGGETLATQPQCFGQMGEVHLFKSRRGNGRGHDVLLNGRSLECAYASLQVLMVKGERRFGQLEIFG
jgi:hypothetical protein